MSDETQDTILEFLRDEFKEIKNSNAQEHREIRETMITKRDIDRIIESHNRRIEMLCAVNDKAREDIDAHCIRIRELEKNQAVGKYQLAGIITIVSFILYEAWSFVKTRIGI